MVRFTKRYLEYRRLGFNRADAARFALMLVRLRPARQYQALAALQLHLTSASHRDDPNCERWALVCRLRFQSRSTVKPCLPR